MVVNIFSVNRCIDLCNLFTLAMAYADTSFSNNFVCKSDEHNVMKMKIASSQRGDFHFLLTAKGIANKTPTSATIHLKPTAKW